MLETNEKIGSSGKNGRVDGGMKGGNIKNLKHTIISLDGLNKGMKMKRKE